MQSAPAFERMSPDAPQPASTTNDALPVRLIWLAVAVIIGLTWAIGRSGYYTSGSNAGYYLGLTDASMMLTLLLYSLRKRLAWLRRLGAMRHWFRLHMTLGILGPTLILLHARYHLGSVNAAVAFYSMLVVAGSGVVGRFIYVKIHHGLYGRQANVREMQSRLGWREGEVKTRFHFAPAVEERLHAFEQGATAADRGWLRRVWRFFTMTWHARIVYWRCRRTLVRELARHARKRDWPADKLAARRRAALTLIRGYLDAVIDAAQFGAYERLFSWWHILHVPLVYLLIVSAIVHVIAVHMY
jgi:hypothetical protein